MSEPIRIAVIDDHPVVRDGLIAIEQPNLFRILDRAELRAIANGARSKEKPTRHKSACSHPAV